MMGLDYTQSMETAYRTLDALETLATLPKINDSSIPIEDKLSILRIEIEHKGHIRMGIADASGIIVCTDDSSIDIKDRGINSR